MATRISNRRARAKTSERFAIFSFVVAGWMLAGLSAVIAIGGIERTF